MREKGQAHCVCIEHEDRAAASRVCATGTNGPALKFSSANASNLCSLHSAKPASDLQRLVELGRGCARSRFCADEAQVWTWIQCASPVCRALLLMHDLFAGEFMMFDLTLDFPFRGEAHASGQHTRDSILFDCSCCTVFRSDFACYPHVFHRRAFCSSFLSVSAVSVHALLSPRLSSSCASILLAFAHRGRIDEGASNEPRDSAG